MAGKTVKGGVFVGCGFGAMGNELNNQRSINN